MEQPKVSIIIPIYNTEAYLKATVDSILRQTLYEIEILLINDGSTDRSLRIMQDLAASDNRIILFSQENKGLSATRNQGLAMAKGEYIYFMDSDDLLEATTLEECYSKCQTLRLDFLFFDADTFSDDDHIRLDNKYSRTQGLEDRIYNGVEMLNLQLDTFRFQSSACLSFIRRSFLERIKLIFLPGIIHEDQLFTAQLYMSADRTGFIAKPFFKRRIRANSIMTRRFSYQNMKCYFIVSSKLLEFSKDKNNEIKKTVRRFISIMLNATVYRGREMTVKEKFRTLGRFLFSYPRLVSVKSMLRLFITKKS